MIERALDALRPGGRLVVNAVTLETQAAAGRAGGRATAANSCRSSIAHAEPLGRFHGWRPAMPVVQWRCVKP